MTSPLYSDKDGWMIFDEETNGNTEIDDMSEDRTLKVEVYDVYRKKQGWRELEDHEYESLELFQPLTVITLNELISTLSDWLIEGEEEDTMYRITLNNDPIYEKILRYRHGHVIFNSGKVPIYTQAIVDGIEPSVLDDLRRIGLAPQEKLNIPDVLWMNKIDTLAELMDLSRKLHNFGFKLELDKAEFFLYKLN